MRDRQLYAKILGLKKPWYVEDVDLSTSEGEVKVFIQHDGKKASKCSVCCTICPGYDHVIQSLRHLDTCQFKTIIVARVPRTNCPEHGVLASRVPWAESGSRYTSLFEALIIDWLKEATVKAVGQQMKLSRKNRKRKNRTPINILVEKMGILFSSAELCITIVIYSDKKSYLHNERPGPSFSWFKIKYFALITAAVDKDKQLPA